MTELTFAQKARKFVRDLLGSRLVEHLETELFHQQTMYDARLNERDQEIAQLRQEALRLRAKFDEYELDPSYFWWLAERGKRTPPPDDNIHSVSEVPAPKSWREIQTDWYRQQASEESSNGVPDSGRVEVVR